MPQPSNGALVRAAQSFLLSMARDWVARHPGAPIDACRVPVWSEMNTADRSVICRAIRSAFAGADAFEEEFAKAPKNEVA